MSPLPLPPLQLTSFHESLSPPRCHPPTHLPFWRHLCDAALRCQLAEVHQAALARPQLNKQPKQADRLNTALAQYGAGGELVQLQRNQLLGTSQGGLAGGNNLKQQRKGWVGGKRRWNRAREGGGRVCKMVRACVTVKCKGGGREGSTGVCGHLCVCQFQHKGAMPRSQLHTTWDR